MVKKFNYFNEPFDKYRTEVDTYIAEKVSKYRDLIDDNLKDSPSKDFYRSIFYIINNFLDDNTDNNQLFIQLPCEELGRRADEQAQNFSILQHIVAESIFLSTADSFNKIKAPSSIQDCELNSFYCMGNKVLNPNDKTERERIWMVSYSERLGKKFLSEQIPDTKRFKISQSESAYETHKSDTFLVKDNLGLPTDNTPVHGTKKSNLLKKLSIISNKLTFYKNLRTNSQYSNALIVCFGEDWSDTLVDSEIIESPVKSTKRFDSVDENYDIVVFIDNRKYMCFKDLIQEKIAYGDVSKVIYIGSEIFDGYEDQANAVKYSFSFRELYSYFFNKQNQDRGYFPYIEIHMLDFPWLNETIHTINEYLITCPELTPEDRSNVLSYSIYPFLGITPNIDINKCAENLREFIFENIDMPYEEVESLITLYSELQFPAVTPKKSTRDELAREHCSDKNFLIENHKSFKDAIKKIIKEKNRHTNRIFLDVKGDWRAYVEMLKYLLRSGTVGHFYFLTYFRLDLIEKFIKDELKIYKADYRRGLLNGISLHIDEHDSTTDLDGDLSSFYKPIEIDEFYNSNTNVVRQSTQFVLSSDDCEKRNTTGDVIFGSASVPLQTIYENKEDYLPAEITFYDMPDNFQLLMKLKYSFPPDRDVAYYSSLWKKALEEHCESQYKGKYKAMEKAEFPYLKNLKSYMGARSDTRFPRQINPLVRKLLTLSLITREDAMYILAADRANKQNSQNGMELKEALYEYKLTGKKMKILEDIERAAALNGENIDADSIMHDALTTLQVTDIEKFKNNDKDEQ